MLHTAHTCINYYYKCNLVVKKDNLVSVSQITITPEL